MGSEYKIILGACKLYGETYCVPHREAICRESTAARATSRRNLPALCPRVNCVADELLPRYH